MALHLHELDCIFEHQSVLRVRFLAQTSSRKIAHEIGCDVAEAPRKLVPVKLRAGSTVLGEERLVGKRSETATIP